MRLRQSNSFCIVCFSGTDSILSDTVGCVSCIRSNISVSNHPSLCRLLSLSWRSSRPFTPPFLHFAPLFAESFPKKAPFWLRLAVFPCVFVLAEYLQSLGTFAFPWCRLFVTQAAVPALLQSASLFGSYFLTYFLLFVNSLLAAAVLLPQFRKRAVTFALALFGLNFAFGAIRLAKTERAYAPEPMLISVPLCCRETIRINIKKTTRCKAWPRVILACATVRWMSWRKTPMPVRVQNACRPAGNGNSRHVL